MVSLFSQYPDSCSKLLSSANSGLSQLADLTVVINIVREIVKSIMPMMFEELTGKDSRDPFQVLVATILSLEDKN